jgi:hypothetical protein
MKKEGTRGSRVQLATVKRRTRIDPFGPTIY